MQGRARECGRRNKEYNKGNKGQTHKSELVNKRTSVDRGLTCAKVLAFACCMTLGAVPQCVLWQYGFLVTNMMFLYTFASMTLGLLIYFTLGCTVLGVFVSSYSLRLGLGESGHAGETALIAIVCNVAVHAVTITTVGLDPMGIGLIAASAVFFTYPVYYLVTTLWNLQPEVRGVITGKVRVNTTHYANVPRKVRSSSEYLPITISLPVYTESNEVIFKTINDCQRALAHYVQASGQTANLLVSDDGLAKLLGGNVTSEAVELCLAIAQKQGNNAVCPNGDVPEALGSAYAAFLRKANISSKSCIQAAERIVFYGTHLLDASWLYTLLC